MMNNTYTYRPFFIDGKATDPAYINTRDNPRGADSKAFVEHLWGKYQSYSDSHFLEDARNHFPQRFWEMYLAVTLLDKDFSIKKHGDVGPEFSTQIDGKRVWFEAIAPTAGEGPDQVPELVFGEVQDVPVEKIILRITNAFDEKKNCYKAAVQAGIISPDDAYILAINSRGIRNVPDGDALPYYIRAFLPIGSLTITIDPITRKAVEPYYAYQPKVVKISGTEVSTRAFLDPDAKFCSAVIHSSVDCTNHSQKMGGDFSILHNPYAIQPIMENTFQWCRQYILHGKTLNRIDPIM